ALHCGGGPRINLQFLKNKVRQLKLELIALALAARHPQTPWYAKLIIAGAVAYAVTPVDVIPDFIPVLGVIDDLIFVPVAVALAVRFVPAPVLAECRARSLEVEAALPRMSKPLWVMITVAWVGAVVLAAWLTLQ